MAITYNTAPSGTPSVHDNLWHVASSDNSGQVDFKFVFDIFINGVQKIRVKQYPEPSNGKGYFDAGPTVRNSMTYAWFEPINSSAYVAHPDLSGQIGISYALRIGEDYSGVTTLNMASGTTQAFNWRPDIFKRRTDRLTLKVNKWLTDRPLTTSAEIGENIFIPFYSTPGDGITLYCARYNHSNSVIGTDSGAAITLANGVRQLNIGTSALGSTLSITFDDTVKYYEVYFLKTGAFVPYDSFRVYLTCNPKYTNYPVHFLNSYGMWDTKRFDLVSELEMNIERKSFGQRDHQFNGNSVDYMSSSNRFYEGKINYSNKASWSYKLNADALNDDEYTWLADLMTSPQILLEKDGYFYPATIKKTSYKYGQHVVDRLKAFEVEFELNTERLSQLR